MCVPCPSNAATRDHGCLEIVRGVGCIVDAIPVMIIFRNPMHSVAERVHMHPVHFAIMGGVAPAFVIFFPDVIFFPYLIMPTFV